MRSNEKLKSLCNVVYYRIKIVRSKRYNIKPQLLRHCAFTEKLEKFAS